LSCLQIGDKPLRKRIRIDLPHARRQFHQKLCLCLLNLGFQLWTIHQNAIEQNFGRLVTNLAIECPDAFEASCLIHRGQVS